MVPFRLSILASVLLALVSLMVGPFVAGCGGGIPITEETLFQNKRSIHPADFEMDGVTLEEHRIPVEPQVELDAWHFRRADSPCTVAYFGGQGFHMALAGNFTHRFLEQFDAALWLSDYRGYGRSGGEPDVEALKNDAARVLGEARRRSENDCLVVHGHSMGTFVATWLAAREDVDGVVLENPATSAEAWADAMVPWYLDLFISFDIAEPIQRQDNLAHIGAIEAPLLVIGGGDDPITPPSQARTLYEKADADPKWLEVIDGGGHNGLIGEQPYIDVYRKLLEAAAQRR